MHIWKNISKHCRQLLYRKESEKVVDSIVNHTKTIAVFLLIAGLLFGNGIAGITAKGYKNLSKVPAFDGAVAPIKYSLNWMALSNDEFKKFKAGQLTYDNAGTKLMKLPKYDPNQLCNISPKDTNWKTMSRVVQDAFLTYVTVFSGQYTGGSEKACEFAGSHTGIDMRAAKGTPVVAIANGIVIKALKSGDGGKQVCILMPNVPSMDDAAKKENYVSCYLHLDSITDGLQPDTVVKKGDQIGVVGQTGNATTYHLHFQIDKESAPFYPYWPFTSKEAKTAGLSISDAVDQGLFKDRAAQYSISPMQWIQLRGKMPDSSPDDNQNN